MQGIHGDMKDKLAKPSGLHRPKRPKLRSVSSLKTDVWEACKQAVRRAYVNSDGSWRCFTCDRRITHPRDAHTGHFIASSIGGATLRYNLDNLRIQCYNCNINLGGNGAEFYQRLVKEVGQAKVDELFALKNAFTKADRAFYTARLAELT